jgi:hypothetical protein
MPGQPSIYPTLEQSCRLAPIARIAGRVPDVEVIPAREVMEGRTRREREAVKPHGVSRDGFGQVLDVTGRAGRHGHSP